MKKVEGILREQNRYAATFYNIKEHSPISGIRAGLDAFKNSGADIIVSLGGGSPIDASKAIIFFLHEELGGEFLRQIAIPTTLSCAEYTVRYEIGFDRCPNFAKVFCRIYQRREAKDTFDFAVSCSLWRNP